MGDSITFGQHLPLGIPPWPQRIDAVGRGVCGETTRRALERFPRDVQEFQADVVVLQWGHNDCNRWETDFGLPRVSLPAFKANLAEMVDRCRAVGSTPILCSITPSAKSTQHGSDVAAYSRAVREVAKEKRVALAPVRSAFVEREWYSLLMDDGVHLSDEGHEVYAQTVRDTIESVRGKVSEAVAA